LVFIILIVIFFIFLIYFIFQFNPNYLFFIYFLYQIWSSLFDCYLFINFWWLWFFLCYFYTKFDPYIPDHRLVRLTLVEIKVFFLCFFFFKFHHLRLSYWIFSYVIVFACFQWDYPESWISLVNLGWHNFFFIFFIDWTLVFFSGSFIKH